MFFVTCPCVFHRIFLMSMLRVSFGQTLLFEIVEFVTTKFYWISVRFLAIMLMNFILLIGSFDVGLLTVTCNHPLGL